MTRTFRCLVFTVVAVLAVGGCSQKTASNSDTSDRPTVEVTAQPQDPQSARVVVEQLFGLLVGGDWAGVWELWTEAAQKEVPKDAFVDLVATCPDQGKSYEVTDVKSVDDKTTTVKWKRQNAAGAEEAGSTTAKYEGGAWHIDPDAAALAKYKTGSCP